MKVLDRYILREMIIPIIFCSLSLISLVLIADVFDNLDEFLRHETSMKIILKYYASLVPYAFVQTISWATWLATVYILINFGLHNELLAMKVAGIKISTIIRPMIFLGFLIGVLTFLTSDRLLPWSYKTAKELGEIHIHKQTDKEDGRALHNVTYYSSENHLYYIRTLSLTNSEAKNVIILWQDRISNKTRQKLVAQKAIWRQDKWHFYGAMEQQIDTGGRILGEPRAYAERTYDDLTVSPQDLANASRDTIYLTYREMKGVMEKLKKTGVNIQSEMVDLQTRLASPWQSLVMMLIVIPFLGPTRTRRGIATAVLGCIGVIFAYHVTTAIGIALGKSGILIPFLSAWFGNIVFASGTLFALDKANL